MFSTKLPKAFKKLQSVQKMLLTVSKQSGEKPESIL